MKKTILFLFAFLLLIPLVEAQLPIFQTNIVAETPSLTIVHPKCIIFAAGNSKSMPFDILNSTYSRLTNKTTVCEFFMVDSFGGGIANGTLNYSQDLGYWHYDLNTTHTAIEGCYSYYVHCNMSGIEFGFISEKITILEGGEILETTAGSIKLVGALLGILILVAVFIILTFNLGEEHYLLKLFFMLMAIITITVIPQLIIKGVSSAEANIIKIPLWVFRIFVTYVSVYIFYNWAVKSERFMRWFGQQK